MDKKTFVVPNIGCDGCVRSVVNELTQVLGVANVSGDVDTKSVTVEWEAPATWDTIKDAITAIDYPPAEAV